MKSLIGVCVMLIASVVLVGAQQRVAPGVPPQQYQQQYAPPPPPSPQQIPNQVPQMQQQVQYQQQIPQQHMQMQQQVPVQGVPQQGIPQQGVPQQGVPQQGVPQQGVPHGGAPHGGAPHGGGHHGHQQLLNTANIMQEKQHIQEHIDIPMDISKMTEQELQFHYFKMHDADRNDKLDGCELIKSLIHWHGEAHSTNEEEGPRIQTDDELESLVDAILEQLDKDKDGYIDFVEYKSASG